MQPTTRLCPNVVDYVDEADYISAMHLASQVNVQSVPLSVEMAFRASQVADIRSTVHCQHIEGGPFFLLGGNRTRIEALQDSGEVVSPGCPQVTPFPVGLECKPELSLHLEFGMYANKRILAALAE